MAAAVHVGAYAAEGVGCKRRRKGCGMQSRVVVPRVLVSRAPPRGPPPRTG